MKNFVLFNIFMLLLLNIGFANSGNKPKVRKISDNKMQTILKDNIKTFHQGTNKQAYNGLSNYFVITKLDTAVEKYAYSTPIDIYKDSLLVTRINNVSDNNSNPYFERDKVFRGDEPAISEYSYNPDKTLSKIEMYSFDDSTNKFLSEVDRYTYTNRKLDSILITASYTQSAPREVYYYQYDKDTVTTIFSEYFGETKMNIYRTKKVYSNNLVIYEEDYYYDTDTSWWKNAIINYFYNSDNTLNKKEYIDVDFNGQQSPGGEADYVYNPDKTLNKIISNTTYFHNTISYTYGTDNFISILTPKDEQIFYWKDNEIKFNFYSYISTKINLLVSSNGGTNWESLASNISTNDTYVWAIPKTNQQNYLFKAVDVNNPDILDIAYINVYEKMIISQAAHNTGSLQFQIDNNGGFGGWNSSPGFSFNNLPNVLYSGGFAVSSKSVPFKGSIDGFYLYDFSNSEYMFELTSNSDFDQISNCSFTENNQEIGISVNQETLSNTGDAFVLIQYKIKNITNKTIDSLVVGDFMDLDIPNPSANLGGVDSINGFVYQYGNSDPDYYGMVAMQNVYGANVTSYYDNNDVRGSFHNNFTTIGEKDLTVPADYRSFISSGPYSLGPNEEITVGFAVVAGDNYSTFSNNAELAKQKYNTKVVSVERKDYVPYSFSLSQNYPNPFNPTTRINYSVPNTNHVLLKVFDILGREVAILVNEEKSSGNYSINFNASNLSSGIYFYQMKAGDFIQTRKMLLLK